VANNQTFLNKWIVADVWADLINQELKLSDELMITGGKLSASLLQSEKYKSIEDVIDTYDNPNAFGIFRSKIGKATAFYVTTISSCPKLNHHMPGRKADFVTTATTNDGSGDSTKQHNNRLTVDHDVGAATITGRRSTTTGGRSGTTQTRSTEETKAMDVQPSGTRTQTTRKIQQRPIRQY
jgi:hypothetical protein